MDPRQQIGAKCRVHRAVPRQPAHAGKGRCAQGDVEMTLAALAVTGVAVMRLALILDRDRRVAESRPEPGGDFVLDAHFCAAPLQSRAKKPKLGGPSRKGMSPGTC